MTTKNQLLKTKNNFAFTLVELIIVIVILAILATIAFLSFNSYSSSTRDSVRLSDISNIAKGLTLQYSIGGYYIIPDNSVNIYSGSTLIGYQGKAGINSLNSIKLSSNSGKDPIDNTYYTYNTNLSKNKYQLSGFLESKGNVINRVGFNEMKDSVIARSDNDVAIHFNNFLGDYTNRNNEQTLINNTREIPAFAGMTNYLKDISTTLRSDQYDDNGDFVAKTNATNYTNRYPYTKGDSIGVILSSIGGTGSIVYIPLEDSGTGIDVSSGAQVSGKILISNNVDSSVGVSVGSMSGYVSSGSSNVPPPVVTNGLSSSTPGTTCYSIKTSYPSSANGVYWIKPDSNPSFQVYCDMTTDGGGWTFVIGINGPDTNHVNSSNVSTGNLLSPSGKGKYSDTIINSIKRDRGDGKPSYRLNCASTTGYWKSSCIFNSTTDAAGDCTAETYNFNSSTYLNIQYSQSTMKGLADGSSGAAHRLIYGSLTSGAIGCDTNPTSWGQNGTVYVR